MIPINIHSFDFKNLLWVTGHGKKINAGGPRSLNHGTHAYTKYMHVCHDSRNEIGGLCQALNHTYLDFLLFLTEGLIHRGRNEWSFYNHTVEMYLVCPKSLLNPDGSYIFSRQSRNSMTALQISMGETTRFSICGWTLL